MICCLLALVIYCVCEYVFGIGKVIGHSDEKMTFLLVNPQWRLAGEAITDFGFGPWRRVRNHILFIYCCNAA
jgi:hypothetical protein